MQERLGAGRTRRTAAALAVAAAAFVSSEAAASEGGSSFYLLGSGGPGAAEMPPVEGVFLDNTIYIYHGDASAERQFVIGGNVVAGLDATIVADFATLLWVPSTNVLGGTLALGGALAAGAPIVDVSAVLTGPGGGQVSVSRRDSTLTIGDPVLTAALGWNLGGNFHAQVGATVNVPIGHYREGELANISFHRWVVDTSVAVTWLDPKVGWDLSAKAGVTFNGENDFTQYDTGNEFHIEGSIERKFSPKFSAGVQAYHFQQISGDSGPGARLGAFKGRVTGVGVTAAYNMQLGRSPATLRFRLFKEFGAENRLEGEAAFISLTLPLSMNLPAGAGAE